MARKNITGRNVQRIRRQRELSVQDLADRMPADTPLNTDEIKGIERGDRKVWDFELPGIAAALGGSVTDLYRPPQRRKKHKK